MIHYLILTIFLLATAIQISYWLFIFSRLAYYKNSSPTSPIIDKPVSIIICARNEAENLKKNLPRILNQNYRSFEVIVVNDNSTDDTANILLEFKIYYSNLHIVDNDKRPVKVTGKKSALTKGIDTAKHEILLLTDADCQPASSEWLRQMQSAMTDQHSIGLGYSPYEKKSGWLDKVVRFETVYTAVQYLSFARIGLPYMGVGRNLIYHKKHFAQAGGFQSHQHVASGDDDLFINSIATGSNTTIILQPDTFVFSQPSTNWSQYYRQKARHYTTGKHYKRQHQLLLGLLSLSHFIHFFGGLVLILQFSTIFVTILSYGLRMLVILFFYSKILHKLRASDLLPWIPFLDVFLVAYYLAFIPTLTTGKTYQWK